MDYLPDYLHAVDLDLTDLHAGLQDPALASMNFLNEIAARYPDAVSFAAGRPTERFFDLELVHRALRRFCRHLLRECDLPSDTVARTLFQYGRTNGIVHDLVARHLDLDEGIRVDPESVVVTVGCQEAMLLVLRALRRDSRDILLVVEPCYVGVTGAARLLDMPVWPVGAGAAGVDLDDLREQVRRARSAGLRPRACYLMADFANPTGLRLDPHTRRRLLDLAEAEDLLLLEDNAYGFFDDDDGDPLPSLKAQDTRRRVIYLGSFAKTIMPGARVGYVVADQQVDVGASSTVRLADVLSQLKSMVTVNTSPIAQAVVGGVLLAHQCRLRSANTRQRRVYQRNRAHLTAGLHHRLHHRAGVSWNRPVGGFFTVVTVPFVVDNALLELCAREYGVLWTPMRDFYLTSGGERQLRLAYSALEPEQIDMGLDRLSAFLGDVMDSRGVD